MVEKGWVLTLREGWGFWFLFRSSVSKCFSLPDYWLLQQRRLGCPAWGNTVTMVHFHCASWAPGAVLWLDSKPLSVQSVLHTLCALFPEEKCSEMRKGVGKAPLALTVDSSWQYKLRTELEIVGLCFLTLWLLYHVGQKSQNHKWFVKLERTRGHLIQPLQFADEEPRAKVT